MIWLLRKWPFYPWCHLAYNLGFSTFKYVDTPLPHSGEEHSPQGFLVSFAKVNGNSVEHRKLMHLLWDSLLLLR